MPSCLLAVVTHTEVLFKFIVTSYILPEEMWVTYPYFSTFLTLSTCRIQIARGHYPTAYEPDSCHMGGASVTQSRKKGCLSRMPVNLMIVINTMLYRSPELIYLT